jgi:magnesium-transporting ATPase (P-type)
MNCSLNKRSTNLLFNLGVFFEFLLLNFFNLVTLRFLVWFWVNLNERAWCILQIWSWIDLEL